MEKNRLIELLEKRHNGALNKEEASELDSLYEQTDFNNGRLFEGELPEVQGYVEARYLDLKRKIRQKRIFRLYAAVSSVAAIVVIVFLLTGVWNPRVSRAPEQQSVSVNSIAPGKEGAILTLADGSQVLLDSGVKAQIARQGNSEVVRKNGEISYHTDEGNGIATAYNTLSTARGRQFKVSLPDGTKVWLNAASSIRYPTSFTGTERLVSITGEAYFEVVHNAAMPFIVEAGNTRITDLGTHFNVMAYQDEKGLLTTLLEGAVAVGSGNDIKKMRPGEQALVKDGKISVRSVDTAGVASWVRGELSMENIDVPGLLRRVSRWYDVDIEVSGTLKEKHFFGMIDRNTTYLSTILDVLKENGLDISYDGKKIVVAEK